MPYHRRMRRPVLLIVFLAFGLLVGAGILISSMGGLGGGNGNGSAQNGRGGAGTAPGAGDGSDADGAVSPDLLGDVRIVSLSPAMSRIAIDLGLESAIVGRSTFCSMLPDSVPVCGDLMNVDMQRLYEVRPTHILRQPPRGETDRALRATADDEGWSVVRAHLDNVEDVRRFVETLAPRFVRTGDERLANAIRSREAAIVALIDSTMASDTKTTWSGRVLLVYATDPVGAFGRDTYLDDVLAAIGLENAMENDGWTTLSDEDVVRLDPDAVILIDDQGTPGVVSSDDMAPALRARLELLAPRAADAGRLGILRDADALRPTTQVTALADGLRSLADGWADGP